MKDYVVVVDLVRARSNLDRLSLWKSRFRVLSLKRIIKGDLRRGLEACLYASKRECLCASMRACMCECMRACMCECMRV